MSNKIQSDYDEIQHIKEDLTSLKGNVIALTQHLSENGRDRFTTSKGQMRQMMKSMRSDGRARYAQLETQVKDNPTKAVAVAFAGGILASLLLSSRK